MKSIFSRFATTVLFAVSASNALAGPVITGFTGGGGPFPSYNGTLLPSGDAVGFQFEADLNLTVTDLGILVDPRDGEVDSAHEVGLWRVSDQALLGSASVDGTGTVLDGFIYSSLNSGISLIAGQEYVLAALYASDDQDSYVSGPTTITTDGISMTVGVFPVDANLGLVFPTGVSIGNLARIGPNMIASAVPAPVPAPATLAIFGLGLAGLGWSRRKKA